MKKRSLVVKQWRSRKRAQGLRPLTLWLDTATYNRLQAMAQREQTTAAHLVTQAFHSLESGGGVRPFPFR
jgi:predicted DNA-binding ribbon-helix-helix protein